MNYRDFLQKVIYVMINPAHQGDDKDWNHANIVTLVGFIGNILATCFIDAAWILGMGGVNSDVPTLMTAGTSDYTYADCMTLIGWVRFIILASWSLRYDGWKTWPDVQRQEQASFGALRNTAHSTVTASWSVSSASVWSSSFTDKGEWLSYGP